MRAQAHSTLQSYVRVANAQTAALDMMDFMADLVSRGCLTEDKYCPRSRRPPKCSRATGNCRRMAFIAAFNAAAEERKPCTRYSRHRQVERRSSSVAQRLRAALAVSGARTCRSQRRARVKVRARLAPLVRRVLGWRAVVRTPVAARAAPGLSPRSTTSRFCRSSVAHKPRSLVIDASSAGVNA
jgi:hypothetical protein